MDHDKQPVPDPAAVRPRVRKANPPEAIPVVLRLPPAGEVVRVTLVIIAIVALALVAWSIAEILLLAFAAILVAVGLRGLASGLVRLTRMPMTAAVATAIVIVAVFATGFTFILGDQLVAQSSALFNDLPALLDSLGQRFGIESLSGEVIPRVQAWFEEPGLLEGVLGLTAGLVGTIANLVIVLTVGIYLAFRPGMYIEGVLRLLPHGARERVGVAVAKSGVALHHWLRGQLLGMLIVGVMTTVGMMLLGMPSALTLGFIAGLLEFIPYAGPFLSAVPAILVALGDGGSLVLWVILVFLIVQQLEGSVITPMIQQQATDLPPVIVILSLAAIGTTFGPLGVLLAIPLTVVIMVMVNQLYLHDTLHEKIAEPDDVPPVPP